MSTASRENDSQVRAAALTLHALPASDRAWVLERLGPSQRELMDGLLQELAALGIPADTALVQSAIEAAGLPTRPAAEVEAAPHMAPEAIAGLLSREPRSIVVAALASLAEPEAAATLSHLPPQDRDALRVALRDAAPLLPAVQDALRRAVSTLAARADQPAFSQDGP